MSGLLRYVVLQHTGFGPTHYDLLFETAPGSALATWRSTSWPIEANTRLESLGDHRRSYLDYQGPVSGDRGVVSRIAQGTHTVRRDDSSALLVELDSVELDSGPVLHLPRIGTSA